MMLHQKSSLLCFLICVSLVELKAVKDGIRNDEGDLGSGSCATEEGDECQFPFDFLDYDSDRQDDYGYEYDPGDNYYYDPEEYEYGPGVLKTYNGCTNYEDVDKKLWCLNKDGEQRFCTKECPVDIDLECHTNLFLNDPLDQSTTCQADQDKYCKISEKNTLCQFCGVNLAACGDAVCMLEITNDTEIRQIVDRHNDLRRKVAKGLEEEGKFGGQPKAANMNELVWDLEVARMAQAWANQCDGVNPHDKDRNMDKGFQGYCGQNAYWKGNDPYYGHPKKKFLTKAVDAWYNEVKGFDNADVSKYGSGDHDGTVGHYTQLVWADATKIGCGYVQRWDGEWFSETIKCNYCPGGNWEDMPIYKVGEPGSECPEDRKTYDGLCVPK